jgi:hypothetical protein
VNLYRWVCAEWDRVAAWTCIALGAIALLVGWIGASGTAYTAEQVPFLLSGGVGGVFLLGLGAMLWLSADLRDEWSKLDRLESIQRRALELALRHEGLDAESDGLARGGSITDVTEGAGVSAARVERAKSDPRSHSRGSVARVGH